ncbi:COP9 signalosome (CSN) subunit [Microbotryomycetes sp. JL201]|nr:COP9 signalosome (CSN) subunit [Microbotryomycetes sp. JL201]
MAPMTAPAYMQQLQIAIDDENGRRLAQLFSMRDHHAVALFQGLSPLDKTLDQANPSYIQAFSKRFKGQWSAWAELAASHTQVIVALNDFRPDSVTGRARKNGDMITAFQKQHELVNVLYRWLMSQANPTGWLLPLLYQACRDLKDLAQQADGQHALRGEKLKELEEASRLMQKCFSACVNDRGADNRTSRKMGTYYMAVLMFKTYIKLRSTALCKNLVRGIGAADLAPFEAYPSSHQVAYLYYMGVFAFLREDYTDAEKNLLAALSKVHSRSTRNIEQVWRFLGLTLAYYNCFCRLILNYLIPLILLRGVLPSAKTLAMSERLAAVYRPFLEAFKTGNVQLYDSQLQVAEKRLMERGTYLIVERAREGAVRALLKKAWILEAKPARMSIERFQAYYTRGTGTDIDAEEMECVIANMIYKNLMKGYISHQHQLVVLSKQNPFPWYPPFRDRGEVAKRRREEQEVAERQKMPPGIA